MPLPGQPANRICRAIDNPTRLSKSGQNIAVHRCPRLQGWSHQRQRGEKSALVFTSLRIHASIPAPFLQSFRSVERASTFFLHPSLWLLCHQHSLSIQGIDLSFCHSWSLYLKQTLALVACQRVQTLRHCHLLGIELEVGRPSAQSQSFLPYSSIAFTKSAKTACAGFTLLCLDCGRPRNRNPSLTLYAGVGLSTTTLVFFCSASVANINVCLNPSFASFPLGIFYLRGNDCSSNSFSELEWVVALATAAAATYTMAKLK